MDSTSRVTIIAISVKRRTVHGAAVMGVLSQTADLGTQR
jgi:hypothetical protein